MWYVIDMDYGVKEFGESLEELKIKIYPTKVKRTGKGCYEFRDEGLDTINTLYVYDSRERAIKNGFGWAIRQLNDNNEQMEWDELIETGLEFLEEASKDLDIPIDIYYQLDEVILKLKSIINNKK